MHDRLQVGDAGHRVRVPARPVKDQRAAPVVADEHDVAAHAQLVEQRVEVRLVLGQRVALVARARQLGGVAVADEVGRDHATAIRHRRGITLRHRYDEVGIAVQQNDGSPRALVDR